MLPEIGVLFLAALLGLGLLNVRYSLWFAAFDLVGIVNTGNWCEIEDQDGTIGFWKNWDSHNTYSQGQIEGWLSAIDSSSSWLGPTTVGDMEDALTMGPDHTMRDMFIA